MAVIARKQLSIFLENQPGMLAKVAKELGAAGVNIRAIAVSDTVDHAVVRFVVDEEAKAVRVCEEANVLCLVGDILEVELPDKPGALAGVAQALGEAKVNIDYAYGSGGAKDGPAHVYFRVGDVPRAKEVAEAHLGKRKP